MSKESNDDENQAFQGHEHDREPYYRAARFRAEQQARRAYVDARTVIHDVETHISVYRFQLNRIWHVAAVSATMPEPLLRQQIADALAAGETTTLPSTVLRQLLARHLEVMGYGLEWFEQHYPGGWTLP